MALPQETQLEIWRRYRDRPVTGETVTQIADAFNIARQTVPVIFRRIEKETPGSQLRGGSSTPDLSDLHLTHQSQPDDTRTVGGAVPNR